MLVWKCERASAQSKCDRYNAVFSFFNLCSLPPSYGARSSRKFRRSLVLLESHKPQNNQLPSPFLIDHRHFRWQVRGLMQSAIFHFNSRSTQCCFIHVPDRKVLLMLAAGTILDLQTDNKQSDAAKQPIYQQLIINILFLDIAIRRSYSVRMSVWRHLVVDQSRIYQRNR